MAGCLGRQVSPSCPTGGEERTVQKNRVARVAQTVHVNAKTDERTMLYIVKNALPHLPAQDKGLHPPVDGAPSHMHASVPLAMKKHRYQEYICPLGVTPWAQACNKTEINKNFGQDMEHRYTDWVGEELERDLDDRKPVPAPPRDLFAQWVRDASEHIPDEDLRKAMVRAIFPGGLKLWQLEDVAFFAQQHPMNVDFVGHAAQNDFESDSCMDSGTDTDTNSD